MTPPSFLFGTAGVSTMMVICSGLISYSACTIEGRDTQKLLYLDCLATQNLGHAAFLLGFATSAWRGGNALGLSFTYMAPRLLAGHSLAALFSTRSPATAHFLIGAFTLVATGAAIAAPSFSSSTHTCIKGSFSAKITSSPTVVKLASFGVTAAFLVAAFLSAFFAPMYTETSLPWPALFTEGYTLAFHVAFVAAVGLACAAVLDKRVAGDDAVIYATGFVSAAATTAVSLVVDGFFAGKKLLSGSYWVMAGIWTVAAAVVVHAIRGTPSGQLETKPENKGKIGVCDIKIADAIMNSTAGRSTRSLVVDLRGLAAAGIPGASLAYFCAIVHGGTFIWQSVLVALTAPSPGVTFDRAVNFSIHGCGIFLFNTVLMFHDPGAFPRLRNVSIFACFAGGIGSASTAYIFLSALAPGTSWRNASAVLFVVRAVVGAALGVSLVRLPDNVHELLRYEEHNTDSDARLSTSFATIDHADPVPLLQASDELTSQKERPVVRSSQTFGLARLVRDQNSHFLPWWISCVVCFAAFTWLRANYGVPSPEPIRVLETPPGYLLGFHFIFILCGFSAHGLRTKFHASLRIGSGFLGAAAIVALVQLMPLLKDDTEDRGGPQTALIIGIVAAGVAGWRLRELLVSAERGIEGKELKSLKGDPGNFWQ